MAKETRSHAAVALGEPRELTVAPPAHDIATLAAQQEALLGSLCGTGVVPPGFDPRRLQAAADALARKRRRAVAQVWPGLRPMLADEFEPLFGEYAAAFRLPGLGGALADGRAFARFLAARGLATDDVVLQALAVDARYRRRDGGLERRRRPWFGLARLPGGGFALTLCGRDGGVRCFRFAPPWSGRRAG